MPGRTCSVGSLTRPKNQQRHKRRQAKVPLMLLGRITMPLLRPLRKQRPSRHLRLIVRLVRRAASWVRR